MIVDAAAQCCWMERQRATAFQGWVRLYRSRRVKGVTPVFDGNARVIVRRRTRPKQKERYLFFLPLKKDWAEAIK